MKCRFIIVISMLFMLSCQKGFVFKKPVLFERQELVYPNTKFMHVSDLHYYDSSLGISGAKFEEYLENDRKLLRESRQLVGKLSLIIKESEADFVLVSGDITKDGELVNHEYMARVFQEIEKSGKKVFVIPGNHDINNGNALRFIGDETRKVRTINEVEFATIYRHFGYQEALYRDAVSLSYVAEPIPGLWLLAIDSNKWYLNSLDASPHTDGVVRDETMRWIEAVLQIANQKNKPVITMMHHGVLPHYKSNLKYYGEYIVDNHGELAKMLAFYQVSVVFTGHFHAQDITKKSFKDLGVLYDIETGSLMTYPCPYRMLSIEDNVMHITSGRINSLEGFDDFSTYAKDFVYEGTMIMAKKKLLSYGVSEKDIEKIVPIVAESYLAHLQGDEPENWKMPPLITHTGFFGALAVMFQKDLLYGWHNDLPPADNELFINLVQP